MNAVEEAKLWISNHSPHKQDCHEYTLTYMKDPNIVNKITNWITFFSIVTNLGYDQYIDLCENEWWMDPRKK